MNLYSVRTILLSVIRNVIININYIRIIIDLSDEPVHQSLLERRLHFDRSVYIRPRDTLETITTMSEEYSF